MAQLVIPTLQSLAVAGPSTLEGATTVQSTLAVSGQASLNGGLQTAAGTQATFNGPATLNDGATLPSGQTLTNNGTISGGTVANATVSGGFLHPAGATASLGSTYTTTSTTFVSTGMGVSVVSPSTALSYLLAAIVSNNTAGDGVSLALYRSTTGIPAAGAAPGTGDVAIWQSGELISSAANQQQAVATSDVDGGLAAGTTYYYYLAVEAVTGGTASVAAGSNQTTLTVRALE
jgi:hypothetical protein